MSIDPDQPPDVPETAQMIPIHKALRREFAVLSTAVGAVSARDTARRARIAAHLDLVLGFLHGHHDGEDRLLWPLLIARAPQAHPLVARLEDQHAAIARTVDELSAVRQQWTVRADDATRTALVDTLRVLSRDLGEHLDLEEAEGFPVIRDVVTVDEWDALARDGEEHLPTAVGDKLTLIGVLVEDADDDERAFVMSVLPAPARLAWRLVGRRRYRKHVAAIRGLPVSRAA